MYARKRWVDPSPPPPSEYNGKPISNRVLICDDDIASISTSWKSLSIKKSFMTDYEKGAYIDLMFIGEQYNSNSVYRYRIVSEDDFAINLRQECIIC